MKKSGILRYLAIIAACIVLELIVANFSALSIILGGYDTVKLDLKNAAVPDKEASIKYSQNSGSVKLEKGCLLFENVDTEMKNICISVKDGNTRYDEAHIAFTDQNFSQDEGFDKNYVNSKIYLGQEEDNYISVSSFGKVNKLKVEFGGSPGAPFEITGITLNAPPHFAFRFSRFALIMLVCLAIASGAWRWKLKKSDYPLFAFGTFILCVFFIAITLFSVAFTGEKLLEEYPMKNQYTYDQYQQMFSAFHEGRLDIRVNVDPQEFDSMSNPYDITVRHLDDPSGDYWDRAYYNGKFYSYFGAVPVFTVYYPVFFITGKLPSPVLASALVTLYAMIFISLFYVALLKHMTQDVPLLLASLGHFTILLTSPIFALNSEMLFYYIAVISGIGSTAAFLFFLLEAYYTENVRKRSVMLVLTGIATAFMAGSRPGMLIYCTAAAAAAWFVLTDKNDTVKHKIIYAASVCVPVITGAVLIMLYNYNRFSDPFEFGFSYQLTVSAAEANTLSLTYLFPTAYHYFFEPPKFIAQFPYMEISGDSLRTYPRYTYVAQCMGVFSYPVTWAAALFPMVSKKKDRFKTAFPIALATSAAALAFIDMCKAGAHYRYTADLLLPLCAAALIVMFDVLHTAEKAPKKIYRWIYALAFAALAWSCIVGFLLIFANENSYYMFDYAAVTQMFRKA